MAGPAAARPSTSGTGRARRSSTSPGTTSTSSASSAYSARHHDGRLLDAEQPLHQLGGGHAAGAQLRQRGGEVGRGGEVVEPRDGEQGGEAWAEARDVEPLGPARGQLARRSRVHLPAPDAAGPSSTQPQQGHPLQRGGRRAGGQRRASTIRARRSPSSGERGKPGGARARAARPARPPDEVDVGLGRPGEHGVGDRAEADAATVGLQREGRDQPGGQAERFGGGGGGVRDVVAERAGQRQRPGHRPLPAIALLDGGIDGRVRSTPPPRATRHRRAPTVTIPSRSVRRTTCPSTSISTSAGSASSRSAAAVRAWASSAAAVDAVAQRQPDLGREPGGRPFGGGPDQPQDGWRVAAGQLGGRACEVRDRLRRPRRGERHRPRRAHHAGRVGDRQHRREPDPEPADRARVVPLGRGPQGGERRHPAAVSARAGVRDPQLDCPPAFARDPRAQPAADPPCPAASAAFWASSTNQVSAYPPRRRSSSALASSRNRVGEAAQASRTAARRAAVPKGSSTRCYSTGSRSTPSS